MWIEEESLDLISSKKKESLTFSSGYGPSGLPHIGTFSEILRTTCVIKAVKRIDPSIKTRLLVVSDDMDGLRKIPENIPNPEMLVDCINKPLTSIPDPFRTHPSYGDNMNSRLKKFLDTFEFEYEFISSTQCYKSGLYDKYLLMVLDKYDEIMKLMLTTLGEKRKQTYSPFLPICKENGKVLQVKVVSIDKKSGFITYKKEDSEELVNIPVTGGNCKLQWKPDWGMRWAALGVDYEMHGKDLTPSASISKVICEIIGFKPPKLFSYELFLDEKGEKISKSKGNGVTIESWLKYGLKESLSYYLLQNPKRAKKIYLGMIPRLTDDFIKLAKQENDDFHLSLHTSKSREHYKTEVSYSLILNLAKACDPKTEQIIWDFLKNYHPKMIPESNPFLRDLVGSAFRYYNEVLKPERVYHKPSEKEVLVIKEIIESLQQVKESEDKDSNHIQGMIYEIAERHYEKTGHCFSALYRILMGSEEGPRIGSFFTFYGLENSISLLKKALEPLS